MAKATTTDPGNSAKEDVVTVTSAAGTVTAVDQREGGLRRRLILGALFVTFLGLLHHLDHVIRGQIVVDEGLPHRWNHSGWPFQDDVTVFTASLGVYVVLLGGIARTLLQRAWAGYWLGAAIALTAIVALIALAVQAVVVRRRSDRWRDERTA